MKSRLFAATFGLIAATPTAWAVEGGLGRPVSGATLNPYSAVVPAAPGFVFSISEIYYSGDIGGSRPTPIGANAALGVDTEISFTNLTLTYIWDTRNPCWNFASAVALPIAYVGVDADVSIGGLTASRDEDEFGLFDLAFVPIQASYHISQTEHLGFGLTVWAPTGKYDSANLANLSLNNWTFIPTVSYTKIWAEPNIEFSASWGVQFYTENPDTDYENGILSDFEALAIKRFASGFGVGIIGSWLEQFSEDEGGLSNALGGFEGRALALGPILTYTKAVGDSQLDLNARWLHEFEVENRFEGDTFVLSAGWKF